MTNTIADKVASYLEGLNIYDDFNATLVSATSNTTALNLFIGIEPPTPKDCVSIIPYGGAPPLSDKNRQEAFIQIRVRSTKRSRALSTTQYFINTLTECELENVGKIKCLNSAPIPLQPITIEGREGGELHVMVSNYSIKHIKV